MAHILNRDGIADALAAQAGDEEDDDLSEEAKTAIRQQMMQRARQPNLSFFAFVEAAKANSEANFSAFFGRVLDDLFIQRMEGNDEIFNRVMSDKQFRTAAQDQLAREIYDRVRKGEAPSGK